MIRSTSQHLQILLRSAGSHALLLLVSTPILGGCLAPPAEPSASVAGRLADVSHLLIDRTPPAHLGNPLALDEAVERATACSDLIATLLAEVKVASEQKNAATDWRDPELRISYGNQSYRAHRYGSAAQLDIRGNTPAGPRSAPNAADLPGTPFPEIATPSVEGISADSPTSVSGESGAVEDVDKGYSFGMRFYPPNPWTLDRRISAATADVYAAVCDLLAARWELATEVRRLFVSIFYLEQDLSLLEQLVTIQRDIATATRQLSMQGEATVDDVMTVSRRYLGSLSQRDAALRSYQQTRRELASLVGIPSERIEISPAPTINFAPEVVDRIDPGKLVQEALIHRHDIAKLFWRTTAAKESYEEARRETLPWFTYIEGSVGVVDSTRDRVGTSTEIRYATGERSIQNSHTIDDGQTHEWRVDAGISLPVFRWFNNAANVRREEYRGALDRERKIKERVQREIRNALSTIREISASRVRFDEQTLPIINEMQSTLVALRGSLAGGPADIARVEEQIVDLKRLKLQADLEYEEAVIRLEKNLGVRLRSTSP